MKNRKLFVIAASLLVASSLSAKSAERQWQTFDEKNSCFSVDLRKLVTKNTKRITITTGKGKQACKPKIEVEEGK